MEENKQKLLVIAGPTASGKSGAAVEIALRYGGEIISADSMQVYRGMNIGTAKVTAEEMRGIPHHLLDVADPWDSYDVVRFASEARSALARIAEKGKLPILAGGTGFYIQAVTRNIDFSESDEDPVFRQELQRYADRFGKEALHDRLKETDPEAARVIHPNNVRRVIRALEYYRVAGEKISEHNRRESEKPSPYDLCYVVLNPDRQFLYDCCDRRVDRMMEAGLAEEVRHLSESGCHSGMTSMQGLGYKEMLRVFSGEWTPEEAVRILKRDTRHFAKRQITWFKREKDAVFLPVCPEDDAGTLADAIEKEMRKVWKI